MPFVVSLCYLFVCVFTCCLLLVSATDSSTPGVCVEFALREGLAMYVTHAVDEQCAKLLCWRSAALAAAAVATLNGTNWL